MYYYRARYYSPALGRFLQTDPIGYEDNLNLYAYVGNDPVNGTDPTGKIIDTLLDVGFLTYDVVELVSDEITTGGANREENLAALGADALGMAIPGLTGGGIAVRAGGKFANRLDDARRAAKTCCFVAGTLVETSEGLRPIEEIEVGDLVLAKNTETGEEAYKPVIALIRRHDREIWKVEVARPDGKVQVFETTDDHPWWSPGSGWKRTEELAPGMALATADGLGVRVVGVEKTSKTAPSYNLEVADFHTYFVGEARVWVHNGPCNRFYRGNDRREAVEFHRREDGKLECAYCKKELTESPGQPNSVTIDHRKRFDGGNTNFENSELACHSCNSSKGAKELGDEWTPPKDRQMGQ